MGSISGGSTSLDQRSFAVGGFRPTILHDEENAPMPIARAPQREEFHSTGARKGADGGFVPTVIHSTHPKTE